MGVLERRSDSVLTDEPGFWGAFLDEAREWAGGKSWLIRLPLLLYLAYALFRQMADPGHGSWFAGLSLGIHELGHIVFGFLPFFFVALAGSATEVVVPLLAMVMFYRQQEFFGLAVLGCWLSYNLLGIARYIADSRDQFNVYVTVGGGEGQHDWEYILSTLGLLNQDKAIGGLVRLLGAAVGFIALGWGAWVLWIMANFKRAR